MLSRTAVAVTAIISATLVVLAFVAALTFLAWSGKGTEALTVALVTPVVAVLVSILQRVKTVERRTDPLTTEAER